MIRRLLLAVDKMPGSRLAATLAIGLAQLSRAMITGLAAIEPNWGNGTVVRMDESEARRLLTELVEAGDAAGIEVATMIREGQAPDVVVAEATTHDLLVLGRDARFWTAGDSLPSNAVTTILHRMVQPILLAPLAEPGSDRVLVAFDGSVASSRAIHLFALLGLAQGREVQIVSVAGHRGEAELNARAAATLLKAHGAAKVNVAGVQTTIGPAEEILRQARDLDAAMVVMGAYGHGGIHKLLSGSTTERLLQACPCSLFLHH